ncbi:protein containing Restriction endonuclease, type I, EcoRI, R subunit/Type III, Res subunit [Rhodopirellula baltica SWK14]|uniref:Protein containing Restriction endonuclease, type I, EcoRI, R subunit/Type III, Res subunit n=1 Tax=Rhodopirellula baltica SWK14 TaxID=993516 RepID=L7CF86_RHOBT|nr:protein containing Restriction endonuclease, type I, EcoRI, R subunit/Type III, Res subunit [Rhodopirellula baltica SWK14]
MTEDQLEQLSLDWFRETGWDYANGVDISPDGDDPEREDYRVVVLKDRLAEAVARLNPDLPQLFSGELPVPAAPTATEEPLA